MLKHTRNTNNSEIRFYKQIYNESHCTKAAKVLDTQNCFQNHIKNAKATKFLSQSAFFTSKESTCKVLRFYDFRFKFCTSSVAPTRSSTFYAYLITKIGNRNLKPWSTLGFAKLLTQHSAGSITVGQTSIMGRCYCKMRFAYVHAHDCFTMDKSEPCQIS